MVLDQYKLGSHLCSFGNNTLADINVEVKNAQKGSLMDCVHNSMSDEKSSLFHFVSYFLIL